VEAQVSAADVCPHEDTTDPRHWLFDGVWLELRDCEGCGSTLSTELPAWRLPLDEMACWGEP
jgi:hypothetical protein